MVVRAQWSSLPAEVTRWVEEQLGARVEVAVSQVSGFSSGTADRVLAANGRRAFVKAISRERNAVAFELHEREAEIMRMLPVSVRAPRLLGSLDDGEWVALMFADIDGRHPVPADIPVVLDALAGLPPADGGLVSLPRVSDELAYGFDGWRRLGADGDRMLPPAALRLRDRMVDAAASAAEAVDGTSLVHYDCRADNLLIDAEGAAWIIDWPWASVGAAWLDGLTYLLDVVMSDASIDVDAWLGHAVFDGMTADRADAVLAGLAGLFYDSARQPASADMPTIRAFQKAEGDACVTWLTRRWG